MQNRSLEYSGKSPDATFVDWRTLQAPLAFFSRVRSIQAMRQCHVNLSKIAKALRFLSLLGAMAALRHLSQELQAPLAEFNMLKVAAMPASQQRSLSVYNNASSSSVQLLPLPAQQVPSSSWEDVSVPLQSVVKRHNVKTDSTSSSTKRNVPTQTV